jgi:8-oxo-dGTP pyrophosphatase MutT (NUDIX family)
MTIRTLSSRVVYRNRWMTVQEDTITRQDGSDGIYGLVSKPDFSLIIPRMGDSFFLVEQYRYPVKARYLEFPQGSWEDDQSASALDVAAGELKEETGLVAKRMTYLGHLYMAYGFSNQGVRIFLGEDLEQGKAQLTALESDLICKQVAIRDFEEMIRSGEIKDGATISAYCLLKLRDR